MGYTYDFDHDSTFYVHETGAMDVYDFLHPSSAVSDEWLFNCFFALSSASIPWHKSVSHSGIFYKGLIREDWTSKHLKPFFIVRQQVPSDEWNRTFAVTNSKMRIFAGDGVKVHKVKIPRQMPMQEMYDIIQAFTDFVDRRRP